MNTNAKEYLSLRNLAQKYDLHPDTIKKQNLIEGFHYIKIGKMKRYHIANMHTLLVGKNTLRNYSLDRFLID